jgi:hypothetical protein
MQKRSPLGLLAAAGLAATVSSVAAAGQAAAQPDLVPMLSVPMNAGVGVQNIGNTAAGPSHLTLNCTKTGRAAGGCATAPGIAAYVDPAYPDRVVIDVPALAPGEIFTHDLAFWGDLNWPAGSYVFDLVADAGAAVVEGSEANNAGQSSHTQLPAVGVAPPAPLPLAAKPAKPARQVPAATPGVIVANLGKADLMSTTRGS